ncbi:MAG: endonuclease/exonuclease/phosphatase family protein [Eggerthellaceae bacterium]|nr:endonuclease/exonuclease/phosphatase family protein [Eggerthellaceae bacterium]
MTDKPRPSVKASKKPRRVADASPENDAVEETVRDYTQEDIPEDDPFDEGFEVAMEAPAESAGLTQKSQTPDVLQQKPDVAYNTASTKSPDNHNVQEESRRPLAQDNESTTQTLQDETVTRKISPYQPIEASQNRPKVNRRKGEANVAIPRANPVRPVVANYETASRVSAMGPARGMIPASGYKRKMSMWNKIARVIGVLFIMALLAVVVLLGMLSVTEYRPAENEEVPISYQAAGVVEEGQQISALTWNIGYCGLSDEADFFMDGGNSVRSVSEEGVNSNLTDIQTVIAEQDADIMFLQEVDVDSARSYHVDESRIISSTLAEAGYCSSFGTNYLVAFVPYPIPPIGQVYAGIQTESRFAVDTAQRIQLPCPFDWPVRLGNLKRCLLVNRVPIANTNKQLVLVNVHLEAYDDGDGKAAQTAQLVRLIQREYEKGNYVIVGGDFNQVFSNVDTSAYPLQSDNYWQCGLIDASSFPEGWQLVMDSSVPTCRSLDRAYSASDATFQYYMIDGFICSPNVLVDELTTIDTGFDFSDHNPVRLVFTLSDEETVAQAIAEKAEAEDDSEEQAEGEEGSESEGEPEFTYVDEDYDGFDDNTNEWIGWQ